MQNKNTGHTANNMESRDRTHDFDLNKVDYNWIEKTKNLKDLKQAYDALELDGYFPDLHRKCGERIASLDPSFAKRILPEKKLTHEETTAINNDLDSFFSDMSKTD